MSGFTCKGILWVAGQVTDLSLLLYPNHFHATYGRWENIFHDSPRVSAPVTFYTKQLFTILQFTMSASKYNIEDYEMKNTVLEGSTTTHRTGGSAVTDQIGVWVQKSELGHGNFGFVFLQEHTTTRALRAVKMLNRGTQKVIHREISSMLFLKNVNYPSPLTVLSPRMNARS